MSTSPVVYPTLIDDLGQVVSVRSEDSIEAHEVGVTQNWATSSLVPLGWNHGKPDGSRMVGWTLHKHGKSQVVEQHAFNINPQAITRTDSSRNQMFATQGGFYVDDFGPGSVQIQVSQLVASGRASSEAGGGLARATMREDVLRWYELIYLKMTANPGEYDLYFHDNHLWNSIDGKTPEQVYFPPSAYQLTRSVSQQNVWSLQIQMGTLIRTPPESHSTPQVPGQPKIKTHIVRKGETLKKIAAQLAGKSATHKRILQLEQQIIALTAKYGEDDIRKTREQPIFNTAGVWVSSEQITRMHLAVGEKIILPAG